MVSDLKNSYDDFTFVPSVVTLAKGSLQVKVYLYSPSVFEQWSLLCFRINVGVPVVGVSAKYRPRQTRSKNPHG